MDISQELQAYLKKLNHLQLEEQDEAEDLSATIQLHLVGDNGGDYGLRIHNGQISTGAGYAKTPDLTITMTAADFLMAVKGEVEPMNLVMTGQLQIEGDKMLAMRVANVLQGK